MKGTYVLNAALIAALLFPLAVVAWAAQDACCYNYTCQPAPPGCTRYLTPPVHQCKRTCTPTCPANGCCDFDWQRCTYGGPWPSCFLPWDQLITNANIDPRYPYCRDGANEVDCFAITNNTCNW